MKVEVTMSHRPWGLAAALLLAACQELPPPAPSVPPSLEVAPVQASTPEPTEAPMPLPAAGLVAPGGRLAFQARPAERLGLLLGNPTDTPAHLRLEVAPEGADPSPSPTPSGSPAPSPEPTLAPDAPEPLSPFGQGFSGPSFAGLPVPILGTSERVPPTRRVAAASDPQTEFWINDGDATLEGDRRRAARQRLVSPHVIFYVDAEADATVPQAELERLSKAFEQQILPRLAPVFGEPTLESGDRVAVVLSPWIGQAANRKGMMGYFWPRDVLPPAGGDKDLRQHSNQRHALFISTKLLEQPDVTAYGTLAHEYQHLLMFDAKSRSDGTPHTEETWLDEGFAMLAMDLAGYGLPGGDRFVSGEVAAFRKDPAAYSLTDWTHNPNGYSYGLSYLFVRYLVDRYGTGVVREIQQTPAVGVAGLNQVLTKRGDAFPQVFVDWANAAWRSPDGLAALRLTGPKAPDLRPWGVAPVEVLGPRSLALVNGDRPVVTFDKTEGGLP
ncbi:MAG: hypothetical protein JWM80_1535 [Cyanobacteria bacterium RYN_339]|nr:hypothetical protein [Cyanobacteria bacterium RYN_339]